MDARITGRPLRAGALAAVLLAAGTSLGGCDRGSPEAAPPDAPAGTSPRALFGHSFVMPRVVGADLQSAQDLLQERSENPLFLTRSWDATGRRRLQVRDSAWVVCAQNVAPGRAVHPSSTEVVLSVVRRDERCPSRRG